MSSALGISSSRGNSGLRPVDIRDFGAVPGRAGATATRFAIQAAIDSLPTIYSGRPRTVFIPSAEEPWCLDRPVYLDKSYAGLRGDPGGGSNIEMDWHKHASCFLLGIPRNAMGQTLTPDHFVDLYGKLDATAASAPGQRWGIRTNGDSHIAQGAGPLSYGFSNFSLSDYWGKARQLTVEFATDYSLTPFENQDAVYLGLSDKGQPQPFILLSQLGRFVVYFKTSDGKLRGFNFAPPVGVGVKRIAFQIDLENATASAFIDGNQVAVDGNALGGDFATGSGLTFTPNLNVPFKFASAGFGANNFGTDWWTDNTSKDRTLYGLRISNAIRYVSDSPGQPQRRIDGRPVNDFYSYFDLDMQTLALFPFQDDPAQVVKDRFLTVQSLPGQSTALYLSANHASTYTAKVGNSFRDLSITSHDPAYGEALTLGFALYLEVDNCSLSGGAHGIGSWNWGSNYVTRIRNCSIQGNDAAIYSNYSMMEAENVLVMGHGRSTFWINGSMFRGTNIFCDDGGAPEYIVRSARGSDVYIENLSVDFESDAGPYPSKAGFYAESSTENGGTSGGRLRLKDINFGTIGRDTPLVMLRQTSAYDPPSVFSLDNLTLIGDEYAALVQVEGQSWRGEVSTVTMDPVYPQVLNMGAGRGVVSRDNRLTGPPRSTRWTAGSHVLDVMSPVDGQFSQWRCPASGEYGTPTPPTWQGFEPLDAGANGLAAYVQGHSYWTAGPETRVGFSTEVIHAAALNRVFGGVPIPARGPLYLGISTRNASRTGFYRECSGPGYARVPVGPFVIDADGSARTVQSLAFPAAGADWTDLRSLFLIDSPSGWGNVVAMIGVEPFSVAAGSTLGFDAGVLKVAASRSRDQFASAMFRAIHDSAFNAAPLATPTLYVALSTGDANSSTAPVEPVGNGYARVPAPASSWTQAEGGGQFRTHQRGAVSNAVPLAFGVPSGSWGALRSVYLMDAASGGQVVAAANLTIPRSPTAGGPAPTFSTGAFWVSLC